MSSLLYLIAATVLDERHWSPPGVELKGYSIAAAVLGIALGLAAGVGAYTFIYAKGGSYLTNDPQACANCHIMKEQFDGWVQSSHRSVAACNDCHTPPGKIAKYAAKAANGFRHSWAFTSGRFSESIRITPHNHKITEKACRKCHHDIVEAIDALHHKGQELSCIACHRSVGHLH